EPSATLDDGLDVSAPGGQRLALHEHGLVERARTHDDELRPDGAERRIKLQKRAEYELEVFKPGFHLHDSGVYFRKGEMTVAPITLVEETIAVQDLPENLDPGANSDAATSTGATFEWQ
ncbi:MAG: hypothetical protein AAF602_16155, partial [Myxococcota bacterium]